MAQALHTSLAAGGLTQGGLQPGLGNDNIFATSALDLNFGMTKSLGGLITFTRASSGTYVGSDGLIKTATTNLLLRSEDQSNAAWLKVGATISSNSVAAPTDSITADTLVEDTSTGTHRSVASTTILSSTIYSVSIFAKAAGRTHLRLNAGSGLAGEVIANLSNGTVASSSGATNPVVQTVGDGWYRISFTTAASTSTTGQVTAQLVQGTSTTSYTGDGTSGIYLWGAQLEQSSTVGEYIPTTSTINSAPRFDHNPTTGESLGLLVEEQRTNLALFSESLTTAPNSVTNYTLNSATTTNPLGGTTMFKLVANAGQDPAAANNSGFNLGSAVSLANSTVYTQSIFVKAAEFSTVRLRSNATGQIFDFVLGQTPSPSGSITACSSQPFPSGIYRLSWTFTSTTSAPGNRGDHWSIRAASTGDGSSGFFIWGAQLEAGSFPTSYIPTTTATVTRSADVASITGANFGVSRTNYIRNNTIVGAAAGTPGTLPTNWIGPASSGLTREVVGTGTESGIAYVDVRYFGTTTSALFQSLDFEVTNQIAATQNSIWTSTAFVKLVAGSLANITATRLVIDNYNSSNVALGQYAVANFVPTTAALGTQRYSVSSTSSTFSNAATAFVRPYLQFEANSGAAIDITLRVGLPQLETGSTATAPIPTTNAAVTVFESSWYNQTEGTVFAELAVAQPNTGGNQFVFRTSDNTYSNAIALNVPGQAQLSTASGGVFDGSASSVASLVANITSKIGTAYAANNLGLSLNGATAITDATATMPTALNRADIGSDHTGVNRVKAGTIRRLTYWPSRLPNATLQRITQ